jgi:hypothetical protein
MQVTGMLRKSVLLDDAGYFFDYHYATYVNKRLKVIYSHLFLDSLTPEELDKHLKRIEPGPRWQFFSFRPLSQSTREELEAAYS